tara:strand:+ start:35 stop:451 length:417 start_codon:yes stop_codon:yes gene_type:complete
MKLFYLLFVALISQGVSAISFSGFDLKSLKLPHDTNWVNSNSSITLAYDLENENKTNEGITITINNTVNNTVNINLDSQDYISLPLFPGVYELTASAGQDSKDLPKVITLKRETHDKWIIKAFEIHKKVVERKTKVMI